MPGPPPPPPAAPPPPVMPPLSSVPSRGGPDDRSALLKSIQQGTKLKKTVTVDKSVPMIGKASNSLANSNNVGGANSGTSSSSSTPMANGLGLGGLFAAGMPKLRPTGRQLGENQSNNFKTSNHSNNNFNSSNNNLNINQRSPDLSSQTAKSFSSIQNELKKQMASDSRSRGPPPPAPGRSNAEDLSSSRHSFLSKNGNANGLHKNKSTTQLNSLHANVSTLHRKANSNVNLSLTDNTDALPSICLPVKPVINYGKPNLAPKPPFNGKPAAPPKKPLLNGKPISRAQSMKSPRSPTPQNLDNNNAAMKFGTVRNLSAVVGPTLTNYTGNVCSPRPRPSITTRPNAPPPSIPNTPLPPLPPSKVSMVKPPNHAPPPPPNTPLPQPPNHAPPPPPPHRTAPIRGAPGIPSNNLTAPPPPPRHSSIRDNSAATRRKTSNIDLEMKFGKDFHPVAHFPKPGPFLAMIKVYRSKQVGNKQQAPQPPNHLQASSRMWDTSSC